MNKDNKYENTVGIESTYPKDMPKELGDIPVWNSENWFYEDVIIDHKIRSLLILKFHSVITIRQFAVILFPNQHVEA